MAQTVQMNLAALGGGLVQGNFGNYFAGTDGLANVDSRDVPTLLAAGCGFVNKRTASYNAAKAPLIATAGQIVVSATLANGNVTIANQPDVIRQVAVIIGTGSPGPSAGSVSVSYTANDGTTQTDTISCVVNANTTTNLSKGVARINTPVVSGLVGGTSPYIRLDTTASISVPVDPNTVDVAFLKETIDTGDEAIGTVSTTTLGTIAPTTAPNSTHTYSFMYAFVSPIT